VKIGLGLPNADKSVTNGRLLVDIARRAEALGFSTLATIGRVAYPNYEELVTLAAAAGATERIGLCTDILLAATREPVLLAKQAATLDQIAQVFSPENIAKYVPLKDTDLTNFILLYIPSVKTYTSSDFNLSAYLNASYKKFLELTPEQRNAAQLIK